MRYSRRNQFHNEPGTLPYPAMGGQGQTTDLDGTNLTMTFNSMLRPTIFNEARFGWTNFPTKFDIPFSENLNAQDGIKGAPGDSFNDGLDHGFARFTPSGFAEMGPRSFWPNFNNLNSLLIADAIVMQRGRHGIKFGGEYRRSNIYRDAARFRRGQLAFNGAYTSQNPNVGTSRGNTGNGFADMLLGWASGGSFGTNQGENLNAYYYGAFLQDDWKVAIALL